MPLKHNFTMVRDNLGAALSQSQRAPSPSSCTSSQRGQNKAQWALKQEKFLTALQTDKQHAREAGCGAQSLRKPSPESRGDWAQARGKEHRSLCTQKNSWSAKLCNLQGLEVCLFGENKKGKAILIPYRVKIQWRGEKHGSGVCCWVSVSGI